LKILKEYPNWISYFEDMEKTPQDPIYHAEGNCYIHTNMVLNELFKLILNSDLTENEKVILKYSALFHDIGKPKRTKVEDNGRVSANGHSKTSYHIANELLDDVKNLLFEDKLQILNLIFYHGEPNWIMKSKDGEREVIEISQDCNIKLLCYLVEADIKGRKCLDNSDDDFLLNLEYFKEIAIKLNCFYQPYQFNSSLDKFNYLVKRTHHYSDMAYNDLKSKVYLICGLPGSGKSTYIKNIFISNLNVISLDSIRKELKIKATAEQGLVINTAKERAKEFLRKGIDFVWDGTNVTKTTREGLINIFNDYNAEINIIFIQKSLKEILKQNKSREMAVPENVIFNLYRKLEYPKNIEAHNVKYIF
jgi:putative nucleotidyltransferase with HDIG domain